MSTTYHDDDLGLPPTPEDGLTSIISDNRTTDPYLLVTVATPDVAVESNDRKACDADSTTSCSSGEFGNYSSSDFDGGDEQSFPWFS